MACLIVSACQTPTEYGTCDVIAHEPLFRIVSVQDSLSGATLPEVRIRNISANGSSFANQMHYLVLGQERGVVVDGNELICTPECTFGHETGPWEMTFARAGYQSRTLAVDGQYSTRSIRNVCAVHYEGPVSLTILLPPIDP